MTASGCSGVPSKQAQEAARLLQLPLLLRLLPGMQQRGQFGSHVLGVAAAAGARTGVGCECVSSSASVQGTPCIRIAWPWPKQAPAHHAQTARLQRCAAAYLASVGEGARSSAATSARSTISRRRLAAVWEISMAAAGAAPCIRCRLDCSAAWRCAATRVLARRGLLQPPDAVARGLGGCTRAIRRTALPPLLTLLLLLLLVQSRWACFTAARRLTIRAERTEEGCTGPAREQMADGGLGSLAPVCTDGADQEGAAAAASAGSRMWQHWLQ